MTRSPRSSSHAGPETLEAWIRKTRERIEAAPKTTTYRGQCGEVVALIRTERHKVTASMGAGVAVWEPRFQQLLYGTQKGFPGAMLAVQCGLLRPPFRAAVLKLSGAETVRDFAAQIESDALVFFPRFSTLAAVLNELTAPTPEFAYADPRAAARRSLSAAVVSSLLGKPWQDLIEQARKSRIESDAAWIDQVQVRLQRYAASP